MNIRPEYINWHLSPMMNILFSEKNYKPKSDLIDIHPKNIVSNFNNTLLPITNVGKHVLRQKLRSDTIGSND